MSDPTTPNPPTAPHHPLGPPLLRYRLHGRAHARRNALLVALGCAALLVAAGWIRPARDGLGSHTQLGLPRCSWPHTLNMPCPTCGMTTAFAHTVRGHWLAAFRAQPLGWLLAVATGLIMIAAVREAWTLRAVRINWYRVRPGWAVLAIGVLAVAAWGYKILAFRAGMR